MYVGSRSGKETGVRLTDVNDDGRVDVLQSYRGGYGSDTWQTKKGVWINNGSGFTLDDTWNIPVLFTYQGSNDTKYDNGVRIADLNDDGLPDLIQSHRGRMGGTDWVTTRRAWLNTGSGWSRNDAWAAGLPLFMYVGSRSGKETGVRLTDINDDGRVDVLQSYRGGYGSDTWQTKKGVWINTP
jgi:hypothetical protein